MMEHTNNEMPDFDSLFDLPTKETDNQEARVIMYRFLSEIERTSDQKRGLKSKLAEAVGKSKSFITQLFNGDKLVNLVMLAKFERVLGIKFKIIAYKEDEFPKHTGHQPQYAVNVFLNQNYSSEAAKATSKQVAHIQVIHKCDPIYS